MFSLRRISVPVDPTAPETLRIVERLFECLDNWHQKGVGLSAPQVGILARIFVVNIPHARRKAAERQAADPEMENGVDTPISEPPPIRMAVINPVLSELSDEMEKAVEGCLSIPDVRGAVSRHISVRLQGVDQNGDAIDMRVNGFTARVFQHEFDHLQGILYIDRMAAGDNLDWPTAAPATDHATAPSDMPANAKIVNAAVAT